MRRWSVGLLIALTACSGSTNDESASKYDQSWPNSYGQTSCDAWLTEMDPQQRFAAAADMLASARNKGDGGEGLPSDTLINEFKADIDQVCSGPLQPSSLAEAGASIYLVGRSHYRP